MTEHIRTELAGGVLTVTLARPEKKNAITQAMYAALSDATERARTDDAVRVLLFRSEGDSFSAGNDIADFIALGSQGQQPLDMSVFRFLKALADLDKPAVAAVRGRAVVRALHQPRACAGSGVLAAAAGGDRPPPGVRDVRPGRAD